MDALLIGYALGALASGAMLIMPLILFYHSSQEWRAKAEAAENRAATAELKLKELMPDDNE